MGLGLLASKLLRRGPSFSHTNRVAGPDLTVSIPSLQHLVCPSYNGSHWACVRSRHSEWFREEKLSVHRYFFTRLFNIVLLGEHGPIANALIACYPGLNAFLQCLLCTNICYLECPNISLTCPRNKCFIFLLINKFLNVKRIPSFKFLLL